MKSSGTKRFSGMFAAGMLLTGSALFAAVVSSAGQVLTVKTGVPTTAVTAQAASGEVIVRYKAGVTVDNVKQLALDRGLAVAKTFKALSATGGGAYALVKGDLTTDELIGKLKDDPNVESVSPNYIRHVSAVPNDTDFGKLWGLRNTGQTLAGTTGTAGADIDAVTAWDVSTDSSDTVVAVFDTGVDYTHEDLADNMWHNPLETLDGSDDDGNGLVDDYYGADFASDDSGGNDGDPMDIFGHGTHVAGTIGAVGDNGIGVTGVNWNVKIMAVKVFRPDEGAYDSDILEAIDYVLAKKDEGVNIVAVNASYGGYDGGQSDPMNSAILDLGDAGIIFCAAAANGGGR